MKAVTFIIALCIICAQSYSSNLPGTENYRCSGEVDWDKHYLNPTNPNSFFSCTPLGFVIYQCPTNSAYDPVDDICYDKGDGTENHSCSGEVDWDKHYLNPKNPNSFFSCTPLGFVIYQCPTNLVYDPVANLCVKDRKDGQKNKTTRTFRSNKNRRQSRSNRVANNQRRRSSRFY